jgi:MFS family permease
MLPLKLFQHHNFSVGNIATFAIYAGLSGVTFILVLFAQQVGNYSAFLSGFTLVPIPVILLICSSYVGGLAGKHGPRWFMAGGPIIMSIGLLLIIFSVNASVSYFTELLPGLLIFGLGLAVTVAPLTAAILGDIEKEYSGIGSAINNAVARIAGLLAIAVIGIIITTEFHNVLRADLAAKNTNMSEKVIIEAESRPMDVRMSENTNDNSPQFQRSLYIASVKTFQTAAGSMAVLIALGGIISAFGIRNTKQAAEEAQFN